MDVQRYINVFAITKDNELIPIWDEKIVFEKNKDYGNLISLKDDPYHHSYQMIECIYDLKNKKIETGIELNYYPNESDLEFKKEESIYFEVSNRNLGESIIKDIIFEEYDLNILKGKKIDKMWENKFKEEIEINKDFLYSIKTWKPYYLLDNGIIIKWDHHLYHKYYDIFK